jgi:hypothetical protein
MMASDCAVVFIMTDPSYGKAMQETAPTGGGLHRNATINLRENAMRTKSFAALTWSLAATLLAFNGAAGAAQFPDHPLTMVVPFAAGGPTDVLGRVIAGRMSEVLGQNVVVENVGGAGGMTGSARVAYAVPDGYRFVLGTVGTHAQGPTLYKNPSYDATADFSPVILIAEVPLVNSGTERDQTSATAVLALDWRPEDHDRPSWRNGVHR